MADYFKNGYNNIIGKAGFMRNKQIDVRNAIKIANVEGEITFDVVRQILKR